MMPAVDLARRLIVGLEGSWPNAREWAWLKTWQPAGVILFSRNVTNFCQLKSLCAALKTAVPSLRIMADHEGGPVSQLAAAVGRPPVAFSLGQLDDVELTERVHEETGRRLRDAGVDLVLAPCADVLTEKLNPVIGARSFGCEAELVTRHVKAAVQGLKNSHLECCLKHWPGHGGSRQDSHLGNALVQVSSAEESVFRAGLQAGADGVMPGHLIAAAEDPDPATLSRVYLQITREILAPGSSLLLIADDVSMGALREPMARKGVQVEQDAGQGMLEVSHLPLAWFERLAEAGCDYFLIRGLPELAFPGPDTETAEAPVQPATAQAEPDFVTGPYEEARQRSAADFPGDRQADLIHLDLTTTDRWQVASALGPEHAQNLNQLLKGRFSRVLVQLGLESEVDPGQEVGWLLVSSHRPLDRLWRESSWFKSLALRLADRGNCLVMGHPSLAADLGDELGPTWDVKALYDISCDDIQPD